MKKVICWLMAVASFAALADAVPTYHSLTWKVPPESVIAMDAKYVNLVGFYGDVRVGEEGRATPQTGGDFTVPATTVIQGETGWDWEGKDIKQATFAVEFLNAERGLIGVTTNVPYASLVAADAFEITYEGSEPPVNGTVAYSFGALNVDSDGIYEELKSIFDEYATVTPIADSTLNVTSHTVKLNSRITNGVVMKGNLGYVTIDLNGLSIEGTNAVNGAEGDGGHAIEIAGLLDPETGKKTELYFKNSSIPGYKGLVTGGRGADNATGTKGGNAVYVASDITGVKVNIGGDVSLTGGIGGNSMTNEIATTGSPALYNATTDDASKMKAGADGSTLRAWAWVKCTYVGELLPTGTVQTGENLYIWRRAEGGARAEFDFAELVGQELPDRKVYFVDGEIPINSINVPSDIGDLTFIGQDSTELIVDCYYSAFDVTSAADQTRTWTNLTFVGTEFIGDIREYSGVVDGPGILAFGGNIKVYDCCFTNCFADQYGAICAVGLSANSEIVSSTFIGNATGGCQDDYGGALYASARDEGFALTVRDCVFVANGSGHGGAICTETAWGTDAPEGNEYPIALDIVNSYFTNNYAIVNGGAISAEGFVWIDEDATHTNRGTTTFFENFAQEAGGAIEMNGSGYDVDPVILRMGRGVSFVQNIVSNDSWTAYGAAIEVLISNSLVWAEGVAFVSNAVSGSSLDNAIVYGGTYASSEYGSTNIFDTCIFDGNIAYYPGEDKWVGGGALAVWNGETLLYNCTFRGSNVEAVYVDGGTLTVTNCVIVGNSVGVTDTSSESYELDIFVTNAVVDLAYSAWNKYKVDGSTVTEYQCLTNRKPAEVYAGDSLYLNEVGFNPVAALGIVQPGVYDFDSVEYGSKPVGSSMGAYEAYTMPVVVNVKGTKIYDGFANSNGTVWSEWKLKGTNGQEIVWNDLATNDNDLAACFTITNWEYGIKDAGDFAKSYDAPWNLIAEFIGNSQEIQYWMDMGFVTFDYTGRIERRPVDPECFKVELLPDEYAYTGSNVLANVRVTDILVPGGEPLVEDYDYALSYKDNINPTDSAKVTVTPLRNFINPVTSNYYITAYLVEYYYNGEKNEDLTKIYGETSGVSVVLDESDYPVERLNPEDFWAWDNQNSVTNGTVTKINAGKLFSLEVYIYTDANNDETPDIYQRQILTKVANGEWNVGQNSKDMVFWATLTNSVGMWATNGTGTVNADASTFPAAGSRPRGNFTAGAWLGFENGQLVKVDDPLKFNITSGTVPFLIYAYKHTSSGRGGGRGSGTSSTTDVLDQYKALMSIKDVTFEGTKLRIKTSLIIRDTTNNSVVSPVSVDNTVLTLYVTEKLGAEEKWEQYKVDSGAEGVIELDLKGKSGFYKVGL